MTAPSFGHGASVSRRQALAMGLAAASLPATAALPAPSWGVQALVTSEPLRQLQAGGPSGMLGTGVSGSLWALSLTGQAPCRIVQGLDSATPVATGHGRIAARTAGGGLWVWEGGRAHSTPDAGLAAHAGLLILPQAVIAVVTGGPSESDLSAHRLARFEPGPTPPWREVARSKDPVLPDARPLQADLDGGGDGGHIAVLAGPDGKRYRHGVLGDAIEATRVLWLERHALNLLRSLDLPAPHVFEDIAPRAVRLPGGPGMPARAALLTVRSGPDGGQLALLTADPARPQGLQLAAVGDSVGGFHRWLAPTTDGHLLVAVHTPHIGGVLHVYALDGQRLLRRWIASDVSTHHIGSREVDLAVWLQGRLVLPSQDGRELRVLNTAADWAEEAVLPLPGRVVLTRVWPEAAALAALLDDGRAVGVQVRARKQTGG